MSNIAKIKQYCISNGEGLRTAIFFSGCDFHCPGCFNYELQNPNYGKKYSSEIEILFKEEYEGDLKEAENYLDFIIKKNYVIDKEEDNDVVLLHHYINKKTNYSATSIKNNDNYLLNQGYEQVD